MNKNLRIFSIAAGLGLILGAAPVHAADESGQAGQRDVGPAKNVSAADTARELIGQDVASSDGVKLGDLHDLVIDPKGGRIVYALISSGGVLGFGAELRAVPFSAFKNAYDPDGNLTLDLEQRSWASVPTVGENPLASLGNESLVNATFEAFGEEPPSELRGGDAAANFVRVSDITGKEVLSQGEEVGEIEDVVVNLQRGRATALFDPDDEVTGSDRKLIVGFDRLRLDRGEDDNRVVTDLSRDELRQAAPSREDWWASDPGYPYVWTGYGTIAATTYSEEAVGVSPRVAGERADTPRSTRPDPAAEAALGAPSRADVTQNDPQRRLAGRPSATVVAGAVYANTQIPDSARRAISVEEQNGRLIVSGTVGSEAVKREIVRTVTRAAEGQWPIDNRIEVGAAAE